MPNHSTLNQSSQVVKVFHRKQNPLFVNKTFLPDFDVVAQFDFDKDCNTPLDRAWMWMQDPSLRRPGMKLLCHVDRPTMHGDLIEMNDKFYLVGTGDFKQIEVTKLTARSRTRPQPVAS